MPKQSTGDAKQMRTELKSRHAGRGTRWIIVACCTIAASPFALADDAAGTDNSAASSTITAAATATAAGVQGDMDEVIINGIRRGDLVLPTTVTSSSAFGLDLGVMDTPRNNTLLSKAQLDALNIQNPGGFSYLTSSSYSDAAFGQPAVPRIRGQYADMFFNGMRDSYSVNGYGAPVSFNSADSIDIIKGPASVQGGPGAGVGGVIDITTKMPSEKFVGLFDVEVDSQQKRRATIDVGGPLTSNTAARVSFATDDSGSYYYDMFFHQQSLYAAVVTQFTPQYSVFINGSVEDTLYRENDGVNRANQAFIDNGTYLTGGPTAPIEGFLTPVLLTGTSQLNDRVIIDETPGTSAHALHAKAQIIQTFAAAENFTITNNTFYDYLNRYNETMAYYADTARGSYTLENKTDLKVNFATGVVSNQIDGGFTYRFAHVDDVQNYANEPVSVFDLTQNPDSWVFPDSAQAAGGAVPYIAAFGHPQYGTSGRDPYFLNSSVISNLQDAAVFLEHRLQFSPQLSAMYGLRGDLVQLNEADPLGDAGLDNGLPQRISTAWYGLYNGNVSLVYRPATALSTYLTYNKAQYTLPNANDGAVGTFGEEATVQLRQNTELEEAGAKFSLMDKRLFISSAIFKQTRSVPTGAGDLGHSVAHIRGAEVELNFQPDSHFFATASYSYLHTTLDTGAPFYNFPAYAGLNIDGAGTLAVFQGNQTLQDPGLPAHLVNMLVNYKHESGFGIQANIQVTAPIEVTQSGYLDIAATNAAAAGDGLPQLVGAGGIVPLSVVAANGYFKSPQIPWQYTLNTAVFYTWKQYTAKLTVYNLTDQHNLTNDYPFYGNDFLTRVPPRSFDLTISGRF
jgi:outer membrane receptor for monomeric catechols